MSLYRTMLALLSAILIGLGCPSASAHEVRPAYLHIQEKEAGIFDVLFKTPMQGDARLALAASFSGAFEIVSPMVARPTGDAMVQTWRIRAPSLAGQTVSIDGLQSTMTDALVRVEFADGGTWVERLTPGAPQAVIPAEASSWSIVTTYVVSGIEHILFGVDHLLFVASLMLIVREWRGLLKAITAFTVAHSITLSFATLDVVTLPSAPVETMIALSILLVAAEAVRLERGETSLTTRLPWIVAFVFGLLHGFGFAGALGEMGLPRGDIPLALLSFNIGVEIGQLAFILVIVLAVHSIRRIFVLPRLAFTAAAYAIGIVGAFWGCQRLEAMFA